MVTNLSCLEQVTHDRGPNVLFVRAAGDPTALARQVATATGRYGTNVKDIRRQTTQTVSSITTVDLRGISRIEEAFVLALAAATMALYVAVALAERRQELATMSALGAPLRRAAAFLWSEAALVLAFSLALAALLGWLLAEMLVAMLQHVFDPPPELRAKGELSRGGDEPLPVCDVPRGADRPEKPERLRELLVRFGAPALSQQRLRRAEPRVRLVRM